MSRFFLILAAAIVFAGCKPTEGERCNPLLFTDECSDDTRCVYPAGCGVAFCCPAGPSSHANCQACAVDGGTTD